MPNCSSAERRAQRGEPLFRERDSDSTGRRTARGCAGEPYFLRTYRAAVGVRVPGVFAVGDCASLMQQVAVGVGQATRAAIALNNELLLEATAQSTLAAARRN